MVLYHAISSYQILNAIVHGLSMHKKETRILLLPDFITSKYPNYKQLMYMGIFKNVLLFPYTQIPHNKETVLTDVKKMYSQIVPYNINEFSKIYVAGVHFYFTLYLIEEKISFAAFEDAYGMLCKGDMLYRNLKKTFPVHADLAQQYGLFDMSSPYIDSVICATQPTNKFFNTKPVILFNLYNVFFSLPFLKRHLIIRFFVKKKIHLQDNAVLILTQHFYNLGVMSKEQQLSVYTLICNNLFNNKKIYIKKHPDDNLQYDKLGKNITTIDSIFPSELLPIISNTKSLDLFTISSTGLSLIKNYFRSCTSLKEDFPTLYDESNEYDSILKILKILTEREYK